jgi:hypothetical protein
LLESSKFPVPLSNKIEEFNLNLESETAKFVEKPSSKSPVASSKSPVAESKKVVPSKFGC